MVETGEAISFGIIAAVLLGSGLASSMVKRTFHSVMFLGVALVAAAALYILLGSSLIGVIQILVYVGGILTLFIFAVMFVAGDEKEADAYVAAPRSSAWGTLLGVGAGLVALVLAFLFADDAYGVGMGVAHGIGHFLDKQGAPHALYDWLRGWGAQTLGVVAGLLWMGGAVVAAIVGWLGARHVAYTWSAQRILAVVVSVVLLGLMAGVATSTQPWASGGSDAQRTAANDLDALVTSLFGAQVLALEVLGILLTAVMIGSLVIARPIGQIDDADRYSHVTRREVEESQAASDPSHARDVPRAPAPALAFTEVAK